MLQWSDAPVNTTAPLLNPEWPVRAVAAAIYAAQHNFSAAHNGSYAQSVADLLPYTDVPEALDGACMDRPIFVLSSDGRRFNASFSQPLASLRATISDDRYLRVYDLPPLLPLPPLLD